MRQTPVRHERVPLPGALYRGMQVLFAVVVSILVWELVSGTTLLRVALLTAAIALGLSPLRKFRPS